MFQAFLKSGQKKGYKVKLSLTFYIKLETFFDPIIHTNIVFRVGTCIHKEISKKSLKAK